MGQEIERKYLVDHSKWQQLEKPKGQLYRQGYLLTDPKQDNSDKTNNRQRFFDNKRAFNWCDPTRVRI